MKKDHSLLKNLSDRLNYALRLTGTKKADLARSISVKPQVIQFLCSSDTQSSRFTFEIATALGLNTRWLATGEGEMFLADDPKHQFLKIYKRIPLLSDSFLREIFLHEKTINDEVINTWLPLKTDDQNIFAIQMTDSSMEATFQVGSYLFVKPCAKEYCFDQKYVFAYLMKFDTFIVRELVQRKSEKILLPKNIDLFKEIKVSDEIKIFGVITDCFWHIRG